MGAEVKRQCRSSGVGRRSGAWVRLWTMSRVSTRWMKGERYLLVAIQRTRSVVSKVQTVQGEKGTRSTRGLSDASVCFNVQRRQEG